MKLQRSGASAAKIRRLNKKSLYRDEKIASQKNELNLVKMQLETGGKEKLALQKQVDSLCNDATALFQGETILSTSPWSYITLHSNNTGTPMCWPTTWWKILASYRVVNSFFNECMCYQQLPLKVILQLNTARVNVMAMKTKYEERNSALIGKTKSEKRSRSQGKCKENWCCESVERSWS